MASTSPCRSFSSPNLLCYHSEGPCLKIAIADVLPAHSFPHPIRQFMKGFGTQTIMISLSICSSSLKPDPRVIIYSVYLFLTFFFFFGCTCLSCGMWDLSLSHVGSSSLTRDRTQAPCIGSMESWPLDTEKSLNCFLINSLSSVGSQLCLLSSCLGE